MFVPTIDREDMDASAMLRRAHERGEQLEKYDPNQLVSEVAGLLRERGFHPELPAGTGRAGMAAGAAGMMLRAFGILPAGDVTSIDRVNAPDPESR
ncbi:hypothetical protein GCM10022225_51320 [Plantactinospora mayteni]|uniref:Uncharacterized protein n=2 Tax=Plantactinospora mayteni TaxID=566021 RepID=A0ABQ4F451_9ACTN|nr:hypothetical protein Pma05_82610 [Plantactinospora mayteni]